MSIAQQLQLADIVEPAPVSNLPAIGWWILASLICMFFAVVIWRTILWRRRIRRKKVSLQALERAWRKFNKQHSRNAACGFHAELNMVLKRHLIANGHPDVKSLQDQAWESFLCNNLPSSWHTDIATHCQAIYRPPSKHENVEEWLQKGRQWIRKLPC